MFLNSYKKTDITHNPKLHRLPFECLLLTEYARTYIKEVWGSKGSLVIHTFYFENIDNHKHIVIKYPEQIICNLMIGIFYNLMVCVNQIF